MLVKRRYNVSEFVKFKYGIMEGVECEVSGDDLRIRSISRMLNRCEVVNIVIRRNNDHSSGVLTCGTLDSRTADGKTGQFRIIEGYAVFLAVFLNVAVSGLFSHD